LAKDTLELNSSAFITSTPFSPHLEPRGRCQCDNDCGRGYCCASRSRLPRACRACGWLAQRVDSLPFWLPLDGSLSLLLVVRHKRGATKVDREKGCVCQA
jgi:hypothetical protein